MRERQPSASTHPSSSGEAAGRLGARLDSLLVSLSRPPWQAWTALAVLLMAATFPRHLRRRSVAGLELDDHVSIWMSRLVTLALFVMILALCFFMVRTLLRYTEQDRWPRRAGGVEMDELSRAQSQLMSDADQLSSAADTTRILVKTLAEARDTILLQQGELDRFRSSERNEETGGNWQARGE